jgi:hypothetical protein
MEQIDKLPGYSSLRERKYAQAEKNIDRRFAYITPQSFVFEPNGPVCNCPSSLEVPHHKLYLRTNRTFVCPFVATIKHQRAALKLKVKAEIFDPVAQLVSLEYGDRIYDFF